MSRCLVLDLDGTLVDSVPDLQGALNRLMATRNLAPFTEAATQAMVGDGARVLVERGFAARDADMTEADYAHFIADYTVNAAARSRPYPGVHATLKTLAETGWTMAVCTNKPEIPARALLGTLELDHFFAAIGGGDSFPVRKPNPGHLLATIQAAGCKPEDAIMVGDHHNDIHAALGAGVRCVWAKWGYGVDVPGANAAADQFIDLPKILANLQPYSG
jgi:phosphoglycolate phosphatase